MKIWRVLVVCVLLSATVVVAQTNSTDETQDDVDWSRHVVEAYRDYQQQQKELLAAIDQARADASELARKNAAELEARLKRLEISWAAQHERDLAAIQESHDFTLKMISTFAALGVIGVALLVWMLVRSMNRRVEVVTTALARAGLVQLPAGEQGLMPVNAVEQSNARFVSAIEKLEERIREMEQEAGAATLNEEELPAVETIPAEPEQPLATPLAALLGKAQAHLNLDQHPEALLCAEEALALDANNAEAHVKRGSALEGLDRIDEALTEYDQAIQLDQSLTMAYLRKGGVFNRLERYGEALQCYEQALKTQQKTATPVEV